MTKEQLNEVEPLRGENGFVMAEIERDEQYGKKNVGKVWTDSSWYTVEEARRLRDWLNKVLP